MKKFLSRDPVATYRSAIKQFTETNIPQPSSNIGRIALNLFLNYLIKNSHLIFSNPLLIAPQLQNSPQPLNISLQPFNYNTKVMNNLIIEE